MRSGVAPDHPKIKSVSKQFEKTADDPRFRFFGNVAVGQHISVDELARQEDYLGEFLADCVDRVEFVESRISLPELYRVFLWWWSNNRGDVRKDRVPTNRTVAKMLRDRGWEIDKKGGKMWVCGVEFKYEITQEILSDAR